MHVVASEAPTSDETGAFDHLAFEATDITSTRRFLEDRAVVFRESLVPLTRTRQIFLCDPNGIRVELNFKDGDV